MCGRKRAWAVTSAGLALLAVPVALASVGRFPSPGSQGLRPASGYGWLCAAAAPSSCPSGGVAARLRRPLRLRPLVSGASCPTAVAGRVNRSYGIALGSGPAYPVPFKQAILHYDHGRSAGGWIYVKVLWIVSTAYRGPVLVRGHQLDGTNWLGFAQGAHPLSELQIPPARTGAAKGWRAFPSYTRVRAGAGCYAYQIDGTTFSRVLVFELAR